MLVGGDRTARLDRVPDVAEDRQQIAVLGGKLGVQPLAHPASEGGAAAIGRDTELEIATADDGHGEEIAVGDVVDRLGENARGTRLGDDLSIERTIVRGGDDEVGRVEIARPIRSLLKRDLAFGRERGDPRSNLRADHRHDGAGEEQGVELAVGDLATADDEAGLSVQDECDRVTSWGHRCTEFPTICDLDAVGQRNCELTRKSGNDRASRSSITTVRYGQMDEALATQEGQTRLAAVWRVEGDTVGEEDVDEGPASAGSGGQVSRARADVQRFPASSPYDARDRTSLKPFTRDS